MKVKKYVKLNIMLSIVIIFIVHLGSNYYLKYTNTMTNKFYIYDMLEEKSVSIVNLGSSHTFNGINYKGVDKINLGLPAQISYYDFELLKKYKNKLKEKSIVLIPISIFSFYAADDEKIYKNYIPILEKKSIKKNLSSSEYFFIKNFNILYPIQNINKTIKYFFKFGIVKNEVFWSLQEPEDEEYLKVKENVKNHLKAKRDDFGVPLKLGEKYIEEIIEYTEKNGWLPIFITTPYYKFYNELMGEENFKTRIYDNMKLLNKKYKKNFIYLDYSHDKRFEDKYEYFVNSDHLNEKGAKYFTKILMEDIKKYGTFSLN